MAILSMTALLIFASATPGEPALVVPGCRQDPLGAPEESHALSPPEVKARIDAMLSGGELLPRAELVATVRAAGEMPGMGFWDDLFLLAGRVSFPNTLDCYLAAFQLLPRDSADRLVKEIELASSSEDISRLYWGVRILGLHPELGATEALVSAIQKAESRGRQDPLDKDWSSKLRALASQRFFVAKVSRLHERYSQALTLDAKMRILIQEPVLFNFHQCLEYGMGLEGAWSQRALFALGQEQPDAVASWVFELSAAELEESEWPPGVEHTQEALQEYKRKLAELLPSKSTKILERLAK